MSMLSERSRETKKRYQKEQFVGVKGSFVMLIKPREPTPQWVLEDRDRRINTPRTLNMLLLGDPIFEQSALYRR